ncbi:MAG: GDSL-type esterase/lipase family protein [Fimbriimonas sp.]
MPQVKGTPRTDKNSLIAHEQLVAKAKQGKIDLYFVGDSITRRWGTSDPQYSHFLANWNANFLGWNAANFGWGADTTQNILWRLENGELDGVNPKVIVIQAGTNNLPSGASAKDIAAGIQALVEISHQKAPRATIILTGIFPRNDNRAYASTIAEVNSELSLYAKTQSLEFLNINNLLADENGTLHKGIAVDGLHLDVKGYQIWADALEPLLTRLLGRRASIDLAPKPTGDPGLHGG